jgi:hypothetical protein
MDAFNDAITDGGRPDGRSGPPFQACTYVARIGEAPLVIIEATLGVGGGSDCHCSNNYPVVVSRTLCGSLDADASVVAIHVCAGPTPPTFPAIMVIRNQMCKGVYLPALYPPADWDALLAEQIVGHGGSVDAGDASLYVTK